MNNFISLFDDIHDKFMEKFHKSNELQKENNITNSEDHYLNIIFNLKKISLSKFAEVAKITKPAATQIINKYIEKGYVTKNVSEKDKRVCYIELTEKLKKYFNESYKKLNKIYSDCLSNLTEEEMLQLNTLLLKINDNL